MREYIQGRSGDIHFDTSQKLVFLSRFRQEEKDKKKNLKHFLPKFNLNTVEGDSLKLIQEVSMVWFGYIADQSQLLGMASFPFPW
jgi:hypothetical protein